MYFKGGNLRRQKCLQFSLTAKYLHFRDIIYRLLIRNNTEILLKINPWNIFIWLINLRWWPSFRNFTIINLRGKDQTPWNHESFCPKKFLQLRSTNYQTRKKIVSRYASIKFVCNYYFLYNQKGKVYLRRSKYLILPFVLESGLSISKSP